MIHMRNVQTGEYREVEPESDEHAALKQEVYDHDGSVRPAWEQQGHHVVSRVESGDVREEDLGYDDQPRGNLVNRPSADIEFTQYDPSRELTVAERENGLEDADQKADELSSDDSLPAAKKKANVGRKGRSRSKAGSGSSSGSSGSSGGSGSGSGGGASS